MERELAWLLRNPPSDPKALAKAISSALVAVIEKNNARIAEDLAAGEDDVQEDY